MTKAELQAILATIDVAGDVYDKSIDTWLCQTGGTRQLLHSVRHQILAELHPHTDFQRRAPQSIQVQSFDGSVLKPLLPPG